MDSLVTRVMPRFQQVLLPILRAGLSDDISVGSWISDIDYRHYPLVNVRRAGGPSDSVTLLDKPTVEITAYSRGRSLAETENILLDARQVVWDAVQFQTLTNDGYLHSYTERMGPTQMDGKFQETWRVQMLVRLGLRPRRNDT